jgi:uncharacterized membrane protein YoaK (UPF0700 family)
MKNLLLLPCLLSAAGGFIDVFAWLTYGGVFTNAQTGNIILFSVYAAQGHWQKALRHIPSILAFFPGIFAAQWLRDRAPADGKIRAAIAALCCEIAMFAIIGLLPSDVPNAFIVFALSFVSALQYACFDSVGHWSYTSVVTTGNLRTLGASFYHGIYPKRDPEAAEKARAFAVICASFVSGAVIGAGVTMRLQRGAILGVIALLFAALVVCTAKRKEGLLF